VVGVAENARSASILEDPTLQFFIPLDLEAAARSIVLRVDRGRMADVAVTARDEMNRRFDPRQVEVERFSERLAPQLRPWRLGAQLFTAFGLLALLVTAVGIYSVMAYTVSQRTHEMGVRIALGARLNDVLRLEMGEGLGVILLGSAIGIGIALALGKLVASLLYGVTPRDPIAMTAAVLVLLTVGVSACLVPALRAARVDPVRALSAD